MGKGGDAGDEPGAAGGEVLVEGGELGGRPSDPDAERETPAAQLVEAGQRVGHAQRMVVRHDQHTRAETNPIGGRRGPGERQERLVEIGRGVPLVGRYDHMVRHPDVGVSEGLGPLRHSRDGVGRGGPAVLGKVDTESHGAECCSRRPVWRDCALDSRRERLAA